jgi:Ser/Thr protein kinase RdoA (MazF antagonist)
VTPIEQVLAAFGIGDAEIRREPSFTSMVHRLQVDAQALFLKQHPPGNATRILVAAELGDRLRHHGLNAARPIPTADNEPYTRCGEWLYTLSEPVGDRPLGVLDLGDHDSARRLGEYLARLHAVLNNSSTIDPPPSLLWQDGDHTERIARLQAATSDRHGTVSRALVVVEQTAVARTPLAAVANRTGVVHGDFWPGNVVVGARPLSTLAVVDLESACRAPLLLDVAHFADLGFRSLAGWRKSGEMNLALATTFARAYATATSMPRDELQLLPDLLIAARGCSILWLVERHQDIGPNPTDQLIENDLSTIEFVTRIASRWSEDLLADPEPAAAAVGS